MTFNIRAFEGHYIRLSLVQGGQLNSLFSNYFPRPFGKNQRPSPIHLVLTSTYVVRREKCHRHGRMFPKTQVPGLFHKFQVSSICRPVSIEYISTGTNNDRQNPSGGVVLIIYLATTVKKEKHKR